MTLTESSSALLSAAGAYTGLKSSGWNATMTTLLTIKAATTGTGSIKPSSYQPAFKAEEEAAVIGNGAVKPAPYLPALKAEEEAAVIGSGAVKPASYLPALKAEEKAVTFSGTAYALTTSSAKSKRLVEARQAVDVVFATIDGVVVSWTNNWNGLSPSTPVAEASFVPVTKAAPPADPARSSPLETAVSLPVTSTLLPTVKTSGKSRHWDGCTMQWLTCIRTSICITS